MGEKEILVLFLVSLCFIAFSLQPKTTIASSTIASLANSAEVVSFNQGN